FEKCEFEKLFRRKGGIGFNRLIGHPPLYKLVYKSWFIQVCYVITSKDMIDGDTFVELALSFPGTTQKPHFERTGVSVIGKRMFATYLAKNHTANIFLTPNEQAVFCAMDTANIYPVPNKWGEKGATTFDLRHVAKELVLEALLSAYNDVCNSTK